MNRTTLLTCANCQQTCNQWLGLYMNKVRAIARIAKTERKLALSKLRISFLEAEIVALNKIIEKRLNLSDNRVSNAEPKPGDAE